MRKLLLLFGICLVSYISLSGQELKGRMQSQNPLSELDDIISNYDVISINPESINKLYTAKSKEALSFTLQVEKKYNWNFLLEKNQVITDHTTIRTIHDNGFLEKSKYSLRTYSGVLKNYPNSKARVNLNNDYLSAMVSSETGTFIIEPLNQYVKSSAKEAFLIYNVKDIKPSSFLDCAHDKYREMLTKQIEHNESTYRVKSNCNRLEMGMAIDYSIFQDQFSDIDNVVNFIGSILNFVSLDYEDLSINESSETVVFDVQEIIVSVCASCDPWSDTSNPLTLLNEFKAWSNNDGFNRSIDLAGFWTKRNFDNNFAGLAYQGQVCGEGRYFIGRKFSSNLQHLRIVVSHEIGHTFNAFHNYDVGSDCDLKLNRDPLIMDPRVRGDAAGWSDGTQACALNALEQIINTINTETCLKDCNVPRCDSISELVVTDISNEGISFSWQGSAPSYNLKFREDGSTSYLLDGTTSGNSFTYKTRLENCIKYQLSIEANCGNNNISQATSIILDLSHDNEIEIVDVQTNSCTIGNPSTYTLEVFIKHGGGSSSDLVVEIDGMATITSFQALLDGVQKIVIPALPATGTLDAELRVYASSNSGPKCEDFKYFDIPNSNCDLLIREDFEDCVMPAGWITSSSNSFSFSDPFKWKVGDDNRPIENYGLSLNAQKSKTINGTCMAYFDDDVSANPYYTGNISLTTPSYDLARFIDIILSFKYNFHNFEEGKFAVNDSKFTMEIWDGFEWRMMMIDDDDLCPWFDVWNWDAGCFNEFSYDVSKYANTEFRVRFGYTDGNNGMWTGMIAMDDFIIQGVRAGTVPLELESFEVKKKGTQAALNWTTHNEINVEYYELEKSRDGMTFYSFGIMKAENNKLNEYQFTDKSPANGVNYYRIKLVDYLKNNQYSEIRSIQFKDDNDAQFQLFPNPGVGAFMYMSSNTSDCLQLIEVVNVSGQILIQKTIEIPSDNDKGMIEIDISTLSSGVYFVKSICGQKIFTTRYIKI